MRLRTSLLIRLFQLGVLPVPLIFVSQSFAQPVGEKVGPQFPFLTSSARAAAMADAAGALIDDFSGFGSNPGVLGFMKKSIVDYSTQRVQRGVTFEHIGLTYKATPEDGIAFGLDVLHYGGTDFYTSKNVRKLGFELRTGLAYGRRLSETFSLGVNLQALTSTTGPTSVWAFLGDVGFSYVPEKYMRYGFFIRGIGSDYKTVSPILPTDVFTYRIARVMGLSLAIDFPFDGKSKRIVVALQNEKVLGEKVLIYQFGIEYFPYWSPTFRCAIRGGLLARDPDAEPRFGLGLGYSSFSVDYAYRYTRRYIQPSHLFTLTFAW